MLEQMTTRQLQLESAKALAVFNFTNSELSQFNKLAPHNSIEWYKAVLNYYFQQYGCLPSLGGPAQNISLIYGDK